MDREMTILPLQPSTGNSTFFYLYATHFTKWQQHLSYATHFSKLKQQIHYHVNE
jgi:hypothetical protein